MRGSGDDRSINHNNSSPVANGGPMSPSFTNAPPSPTLHGPPSTPDSIGSNAPLRDQQSSTRGTYREEEHTYRKKTWSIYLREALRLKSRCLDGYEEDVFPRQIIRSLDNHEAGYGKVAAFEDCDPSLLIYRKFGWLHNRALLYLQDELSELEEELIDLDSWDFRDGDNTRLYSRRADFAESSDSYRKRLMPKVFQKLGEYDEYVLKMRKIQSIPRPSARAQRTLYRLIKNSNSLKVDEMDWVRFGPDLAALSTDVEHGWFSNVLEDILNFFSRRFTTYVFRSEEQAIIAGAEPIQLLSPKRFDILLRMVLTVIAAVELLAAVFILFELQPSTHADVKRMSNYQILTIFLFTLLFSASFSILTRARRQEVFTATAAYCAVLVVFLGNTSNVVVATNGVLQDT